jgi:hypothetical protein
VSSKGAATHKSWGGWEGGGMGGFEEAGCLSCLERACLRVG